MRPNRNISEQDYDEQLELTQTIKDTGRFKTKDTTLLEACRWITENQTAKRFRGSLLDHFSASAFMAVHRALSPENQKKLEDIAATDHLKAISICFKLCK
jgi:hypothetical protein